MRAQLARAQLARAARPLSLCHPHVPGASPCSPQCSNNTSISSHKATSRAALSCLCSPAAAPARARLGAGGAE